MNKDRYIIYMLCFNRGIIGRFVLCIAAEGGTILKQAVGRPLLDSVKSLEFVSLIILYFKGGILSVYGKYGFHIYILYRNIIISSLGHFQVANRFSSITICL